MTIIGWVFSAIIFYVLIVLWLSRYQIRGKHD